MKILLVLSPTPTNLKNYSSSQDSYFPLGVGYLASSLEKVNLYPQIFDPQLVKSPQKEFIKILKEKKYDVIGFSVVTPAFRSTNIMASIAKEIYSDTKVVVGGVHPTIIGKDVLKVMPNVDIAVFGEGELTIVNLFQALESKERLDKVRGIAFRKNGEILQTEPQEQIKDLDTIPFPARHLVDIKKYIPPPGQFFKLPMISIISSRGCAYDCAFCVDNVIWRRRYHLRSAQNTVDEMEYLKEEYGAQEIKIIDGTFSTNRKRTVGICNGILKRNLGLIWRCETRVDNVDLELLKLMRESGCRSISFGFESGDNQTLKRMNKNTTVEQAKDAVAWCRKAGIQAKGFFMLNYPGDTIETTEKTIRFSRELDIDFVGFNLTAPYPGSKLRKDVEQNYRVNKKLWHNTDLPVGNRIHFFQDSLPQGYLRRAYRRAVLGFFLRPKIILRNLLQIRSFEALKRSISGIIRVFRIKIED